MSQQTAHRSNARLLPKDLNFMRPYTTVIIDSFREAWSSRVLWVLGIVWTVMLAALAPISINEGRATSFQRGSITN